MSEQQEHSDEHPQLAGERDPRMRPSDPAGTRPKVDPQTLRPSQHRGQLALTPGEQAAHSVPSNPLASVELESVGSGSSTAVALPSGSALTHAPRFQFLFGALAAAAVAAILLTGAILSRPGAKPPLTWSHWQPQPNDGDPAAQIAEHIAPLYKLADGHQLVDVTGGPQAINGQPVVLALRSSGSEPAPLPSNGVFYQLCGTGPSCSIPGKASVQRGLLVRREALELALYTFRYIEGASQVVVTFPPPPPSGGSKSSSTPSSTSAFGSPLGSANASTPSRVLLFRPSELQSELSRPLLDSLPAQVPSVKTIDNSPEAPLVNSLTVNTFYDSTITEQESTLVMLLQAPSLGG